MSKKKQLFIENINEQPFFFSGKDSAMPIPPTKWHYLSAGSIIFQMPAAQAPPTNGPTMKIQRLARAVPPWKMAGAIERAGFTLVPV